MASSLDEILQRLSSLPNANFWSVLVTEAEQQQQAIIELEESIPIFIDEAVNIIAINFFRFDLNLPGHDNQADGLRFHLHPSSDDFMVHSPPMFPLEILHLFLYGFEIPPKMRR